MLYYYILSRARMCVCVCVFCMFADVKNIYKEGIYVYIGTPHSHTIYYVQIYIIYVYEINPFIVYLFNIIYRVIH